MVSAVKIEMNTDKLVALGLEQSEIVRRILDMDENRKLQPPDQKVVERIVLDHIANHNSYKRIQQTMQCKVLRFLDTDRAKLYNERTGMLSDFSLEVMRSVMDPKVLRSRFYPCWTGYNPHSPDPFYDEGERHYFNEYQAPDWKRTKSFESPLADLPELYRDFFSILVDGDQASYEYILKWLAQSIKSRNLCALFTVGKKGVGKGVLGEVMCALHGESNYSHVEGETLMKQFNGFLDKKTLLYLDEVYIKKTEHENRFKMLVNPKIEIETKGVDSKSKTNYLNVYMSSNELDAVRITSDERRFSIINLRDEKIHKAPGWENMKAKTAELTDPANIELLARFLWHFKYDEVSMNEPFTSKRALEVRSESINDWEDYFLNVYCAQNAGKEIKVSEVKTAINLALDSKLKLTTKTFEVLLDKIKPLLPPDAFPFEIVRKRFDNGERPVMISIQPLDEQPKDYLRNISIKESE